MAAAVMIHRKLGRMGVLPKLKGSLLWARPSTPGGIVLIEAPCCIRDGELKV